MEDVNELCLAPFRSVLREANMAIEKARSDEAMRTAARMLCVAGEFALEQLEPPCARRYKDHDKRFIDALRNNGRLAKASVHVCALVPNLANTLARRGQRVTQAAASTAVRLPSAHDGQRV